jgi:hypothetical protein
MTKQDEHEDNVSYGSRGMSRLSDINSIVMYIVITTYHTLRARQVVGGMVGSKWDAFCTSTSRNRSQYHVILTSQHHH